MSQDCKTLPQNRYASLWAMGRISLFVSCMAVANAGTFSRGEGHRYLGPPPTSLITYSTETIPIQHKKKLDSFLNETLAILPESFLKEIPAPIRVQFFKDKKFKSLPDPCQISGLKLGRSQIFQRKIYLNQLLFEEIIKGPETSLTFQCGHQNYYRFAQATLIHELAHFFDQEKNISSNSQFLNLTHWSTKGWLFHSTVQSNELTFRSPDPYERKTPAESFAVNMEFFLLDPSFGCRRPSLNNFLKRYTKHIPHFQSPCRLDQLNISVPLSPNFFGRDSSSFRKIDPQRLYQVHYLFAAQGKALMSRWGHAMLRLVFCRPDRKTIGPDCLKDIQEHIVVSYRANILDLVPDTVKGLNGEYPSQLFLMTLPEVVEEYTKDDFRDLISLPIEMTEEEKEEFAHKILENYWEYQGKYYFLSNNCATESLDLLKGILPFRNEGKPLTTHARTPLGLLEDLLDLRILKIDGIFSIDGEFLDELKAEEQGYLFRSKKEQLDENFKNLKTYTPEFQFSTLEIYLNKSTNAQRLRSNRAILLRPHLNTSDRLKIAAHFFVLESQILRLAQKKMLHHLGTAILKGNAPLGLTQKKARGLLEKQLPWNLTPGFEKSYGIPLQSEWNLSGSTPSPTPHSNHSLQLKAEFDAWFQREYSTEATELQAIIRSTQLFRRQMISLYHLKKKDT